jgi:hypothetical protein
LILLGLSGWEFFWQKNSNILVVCNSIFIKREKFGCTFLEIDKIKKNNLKTNEIFITWYALDTSWFHHFTSKNHIFDQNEEKNFDHTASHRFQVT